jgi:hypothetical protein
MDSFTLSPDEFNLVKPLLNEFILFESSAIGLPRLFIVLLKLSKDALY